MPRKKPTAGTDILDAKDEQYHADVVAKATGPEKTVVKAQPKGKATPKTPTRQEQIRANAPPASSLAAAIREWHQALPADVQQLASTGSKLSAFIADHDEELTALFLKYVGKA